MNLLNIDPLLCDAYITEAGQIEPRYLTLLRHVAELNGITAASLEKLECAMTDALADMQNRSLAEGYRIGQMTKA